MKDPATYYAEMYNDLDELLALVESSINRADLPTVDLIAAGYDWTCPACNHEHFTTELYDQVVECVNCGKKYTVMIAHPEM